MKKILTFLLAIYFEKRLYDTFYNMKDAKGLRKNKLRNEHMNVLELICYLINYNIVIKKIFIDMFKDYLALRVTEYNNRNKTTSTGYEQIDKTINLIYGMNILKS